jgi:hypothetical protein
LRCLGKIARRSKGGPEGLAVLGETGEGWDVLIAFDGVEDPHQVLGRFGVPREAPSDACD